MSLDFRRRFYQGRWRITSIFPTLPCAFPDKIQHPDENLSWRLPHSSGLLLTSLPFPLCPLPHSHLCPTARPLAASSRRPSGCHRGRLCFGWCCSSSGPADLLVLGKGSWELSKAARQKVKPSSAELPQQQMPEAAGLLRRMPSVSLLHVLLVLPARTGDTSRERFTPSPGSCVKAVWTPCLTRACEWEMRLSRPAAVGCLLGVSVWRKEPE